ncbi:MAG TPA: hypothetical protein DCZ10_18435 [Pelotomaculum sp.]|jgi:hypothetical protein|nr:hypothetical protein [Pelotomaculum sp.]
MAKSDLTLELEREIWKATNKQGVFGCFEVTIGWYGSERVDYLTYDTKGVFRCYEIKVSKADFHSKAHNTFVGHYNYYVMPAELYEQLKDEIPDHIGVYCGARCAKKAKKQELGVADQVLKDSMLRSLYREYEKQYRSGIPMAIESLNQRLRRSEADKEKYYRQYWNLMRIGQEKYGSRWYIED